MTKLRPIPPAPPTKRKPTQRKYPWEAIAMAARLAAGTEKPWITVGYDVLRAHAYAINVGKKAPLRPVGHYKAITRGHGDYAEVQVCYRGPRLEGDSPEALRRLLDETSLQIPALEQ